MNWQALPTSEKVDNVIERLLNEEVTLTTVRAIQLLKLHKAPRRVGPEGVQLGIDTIDELFTFAADHIRPKLQGLKVLLQKVKEDLES